MIAREKLQHFRNNMLLKLLPLQLVELLLLWKLVELLLLRQLLELMLLRQLLELLCFEAASG